MYCCPPCAGPNLQWVGGLAEDHPAGSSMGETFSTIIIDQFERLRDGDRFWYQNVFSGDALAEIDGTTLADVIERNTNISGLQESVFFAPTVMRVDLADSGATNVTVRATDGNLQVVDNETQQVISSQPLEEVERIMLTGSADGAQRVSIDGITSDVLPGGMMVEAGDGADTIVISGSEAVDTIVVSDSVVDVNGMQMEFTGVERVVIQGTNAEDDIVVDDGVSIDVDVQSVTGQHQHRNNGGRDSKRRRSDRREQLASLGGKTSRASEQGRRTDTGSEATRSQKGRARTDGMTVRSAMQDASGTSTPDF